MTFVVVVPGGDAPQYVSPSAQSVVVTLGSATLLTLDVRSSSQACKSDPSGSRTCSGQVSAPAGNQTFDVASFDGAAGKGNVLAAGSVNAVLVAGRPARVAIALTGRPASLRVSFRNAYPAAGKAGRFAVTVSALDADGNTIVGNYGSAVALSNSDASGATKLSLASVKKSSQKITLSYDGTPLSQAIVNASVSGARGSSAMFAPVPTIVAQYEAPPLKGGLPAGLADLCIGSDGNVWATASSSGAIEKISADGTFTTYLALDSYPLGISAGADGNLWFVEQMKNKVVKITLQGKMTGYKVPVAPSGFSQLAWTARGPDGRTWFLDQGSPPRVGAVTSDGTISMYDLPANSFPQEIVTGPDGNLWMTDDGFNGVLVLSPSGQIIAKHRMKTKDAQPWGITVGPDRNVWVAEYNIDKIARITTGGSIREFTVPTAVAGPLNVASGPDGNVWFTESGGSIGIAGKIGFVSTDGAVIRDFPMRDNLDHAHNLTFDSARHLWFTEFNNSESALGQLIY